MSAGGTSIWSRPALTVGGRFAWMTFTETSALALSSESVAVRRRTYSPAVSKVAVVVVAWGLPNVTAPGPLTFVQVAVSPPPAGRPSSVAVPMRVPVFVGRVTVRSGPASTKGAWLTWVSGPSARSK